jgi:hypothetical protein
MSISGVSSGSSVAAYTPAMQEPTKAPKPLPMADTVSFSGQAQQLAKSSDVQQTKVQKTNENLYGPA